MQVTLPDERTRALIWAGGFLIQIARDETLPLQVRQQAVTIARHFPTIEDVGAMSRFRHESGLGVGLSPPSDVDWAASCRLGPLRSSTKLEFPADV